MTPASLPPGFNAAAETKLRWRTVKQPCAVCQSAGTTGPSSEVVFTETFTWAPACAGRVAISVERCSFGHDTAAPTLKRRATPEERKAVRQLVLQQQLSPAAAFTEGARLYGGFVPPSGHLL